MIIDINELKRQYRLSLMTFLFTGVVASFSTGYIFFTTRSLLFLLQFLLACSGFVIHGIYLWTSRVLYVNDNHERAHFHGKLESFGAQVGLFLMYVNLIILLAVSLYRVIFPSDIAHMTLFSKITTVTCIAYNFFLFFHCYISVKKTQNLVMRAQLIESGKNLFSWCLCGLTEIVATFFSEWVLAPFVEPVFCIALVLVVAWLNFGLLKKSCQDLLDKTGNRTLEDNVRRMIIETCSEAWTISFRTCSRRVVVDVTLDFKPDTPWSVAVEKSREISEKVCAAYPQCHVHTKIDFE